MFRRLPGARYSQDALLALGAAMTAEAEDAPTPENEIDDEENQGISAGYTYLGQFIDHDLTFDPASSLERKNDPDALVDFRTPRFDLDSVYGRGPDDQPYLYEDDGRHFKLGRNLIGNPNDAQARDLPRHANPATGSRARALIGDPRNDENVIVSQLHGIMLRFHNRLADDNPTKSFGEIQQLVRWHYQWVLVHDFLPTIVGPETVCAVLPHLHSKKHLRFDPPHLEFYKPVVGAYMPIEFSAAAYRFGHSMVRPIYRLNTSLGRKKDEGDPINERKLIFHSEDDNASLNGFREFPENWAIEWNLYFDMGNKPSNVGFERLQPAYKIDTSLVNPLGQLPLSVASGQPSLAARNLLRGASMDLPSGQDVARAMGERVLRDEELKVGKANEDSASSNRPITAISREFAGKAPLWFYVLSEAQQQFKDDATPIRLGSVGGRIVTEVFAGILLHDSSSWLRQDPGWRPEADTFKMADLIRRAIGK